VWVAVRPEKIEISRDQPDSLDNCAAGTVSEIAYVGNLSIFHVELASGKMARVTRPNLLRTTTDRITWDDPVFLSWAATSGVVLLA